MTDDLTPAGAAAVRLAVEIAGLRAKLARVEALCDEWEDEGARLRDLADTPDADALRGSLHRDIGALHGAAITLRAALEPR